MINPRLPISISAALIAGVLALTACEDTSPTSGGPGAPSPCVTIVNCRIEGRGSGNTTPLPAGNISRFAYVANTGDNTLSMFLVDSATGRLIPIGYVLTGAGPVAVATDPASKFLYVANRDDDTVSAFTLDERTGTLEEISGSPFAVGDEPVALLVDPTGRFLYVANRAERSITGFAINANTGALTVRETESTPGRVPASLAVDSGSFLFVGNSETATTQPSVASYSIDSATGVLSLADTEPVGQGALTIARHPAGAFLYAVSAGSGNVAVLSITSGNLNVDTAATVNAGAGASGIAFLPSGGTAYVVNAAVNTIRAYTVSAGTGALTATSDPALDTGTAPGHLTVDPLGERVYVINAGSNDVSAFAVNATTGALSAASTTRTQQGPLGFALVTRGEAAAARAKYAFILNQGASTISSYDVNVSGSLTANGPQSLTSELGAPRALAVDPFARFVYVAHASNAISAYRIHASNGSLPLIGSLSISVDPTAITVEPSGRYLYAAGSTATGWQVVVLAIDQTSGALTQVTGTGSALDTGTLPVSITSDPTGRFLYVVNSTANTVSMFTIAPATGLLTSVGTALSVDADPQSVAVDPSGRYAYAVSAGTSGIQGFAIDAATGELTSPPVALLTTATNASPSAVVADPTGRFVYAANTATNNIRPFVVDLDTGALAAGTLSSATGTGPTALAIEAGGKFLYVTNQVSNSLAIYSINQTSGNLSRIGSIPSGVFNSPIAIGLTLLIE